MRTLKILACVIFATFLVGAGWCWWHTLRMPPTFILTEPPPPLVVTKEQCDTAVGILDEVLRQWD